MHEDLIGTLLDSVDRHEDALITQLLVADGRRRLPDRWTGQFTGVGTATTLAFYRSLDQPAAERFAEHAKDPDVLADLERNETRAAVRACLMANPRLPEPVAERILRSGRKLSAAVRGRLLDRIDPERRIHTAAALPWVEPSAGLGRAVAEHPSGPDHALAVALAEGGPQFAAFALRAAITSTVTTKIGWATVHTVVTAQTGYDPDLDAAIGGHDESDRTGVKRGRSVIVATAGSDQSWQDITWASTRATGLRALGTARATPAPALRAAISGVEHGELETLFHARWWFDEPMSADDVTVLLESDVLKTHRTGGRRRLRCDAGGLRVLAAVHDNGRWDLGQVVSASWDRLTAAERAVLFTDPVIAPLLPHVFDWRPPSFNALTEVLAEGLDPAVMVSVLCPGGPGRRAKWSIRAEANTDVRAAAALPAAIMEVTSYTTGAMWAELLTHRHPQTITAKMIAIAATRHDHTEASLADLTAVIGRLDDATATMAIDMLLHDTGLAAQMNSQVILESLELRPAVAATLAQKADQMIAHSGASLALIPIARQHRLDWGRSLSAGSPPALRAVLEAIGRWYLGDTAGARTFLGLVQTWTGTLQDLKDLVDGVTV